MATISPVNAGGNWNVNATWVGGVQPTSADDVVLPGTMTGNLSSVGSFTGLCRSLTVQAGGRLNVIHNGTAIIQIGDASGGALIIDPAAIVTTGLGGGLLKFVSTSNNGGVGWSITTGGKTLSSITFDGVGGKWKFTDNLITQVLSIINLTNGTIDWNGTSPTFGAFSSNNSNTRSVSGWVTVTLITTTVTAWNTATLTGMTFSAPTLIQLTGNGTTRGWSSGLLLMNDIKVTAGTENPFTLNNLDCKNLDLTGFTGSVSAASVINVRGNLTLDPALQVPPTGGSAITFMPGPGATCLIKTNGSKGLSRLISINGDATGIVKLGDDLDASLSSVDDKRFIHTTGTFDTQNFNLKTNAFASDTGGARFLKLGTSTITIVAGIATPPNNILSIGGPTPPTVDATNFKVILQTQGTQALIMALATMDLRTMDLTIHLGGTGALTYRGNGCITKSFIVDGSGTIIVRSTDINAKIVWDNNMMITGTSGARITIKSDVPGTRALIRSLWLPVAHYTDFIDVDMSVGTYMNATDNCTVNNTVNIVTGIVTPMGINSSQTFGTTRTAQRVKPTGISSSQTFGSVKTVYRVKPTGISTGQAFGIPKTVRLVKPTGIGSKQAFGTAKFVFYVRAVGVSSKEAFGIPRFPSALLFSPVGIGSTEAFGTPRLLLGIAYLIETPLIYDPITECLLDMPILTETDLPAPVLTEVTV